MKQNIHREVDLEEIQGSQIITHGPYEKEKRFLPSFCQTRKVKNMFTGTNNQNEENKKFFHYPEISTTSIFSIIYFQTLPTFYKEKE